MKNMRIIDIHFEFLKHPDNWVFLIPAVLGMSYLGFTGFQWIDLLWFLAGWLIFLPQEYFTHVYILHAKIPNSESLYRWMYRLHFGHHDQPKRHDLMYIPLWLTLPMLAVNMMLFIAVLPEPRAVIATLAGLFIGYLVFEWSHLFCHVAYVPKTKIGNEVRRRHLMHHYLNEKYWYSVSIPALPLDQLFGTMKHRDEVERSETRFWLGLAFDHPFILKARKHFAKHSGNESFNSHFKESCEK